MWSADVSLALIYLAYRELRHMLFFGFAAIGTGRGAQVQRFPGDVAVGELAQTVGGGVPDTLGEEVQVGAGDNQPDAKLLREPDDEIGVALVHTGEGFVVHQQPQWRV